MVDAADKQKSRNTADSAAEKHSTDDDAGHLYADIARGALAFADDGYLIAVLCVA